jgi:hypothetical protein
MDMLYSLIELSVQAQYCTFWSGPWLVQRATGPNGLGRDSFRHNRKSVITESRQGNSANDEATERIQPRIKRNACDSYASIRVDHSDTSWMRTGLKHHPGLFKYSAR